MSPCFHCRPHVPHDVLVELLIVQYNRMKVTIMVQICCIHHRHSIAKVGIDISALHTVKDFTGFELEKDESHPSDRRYCTVSTGKNQQIQLQVIRLHTVTWQFTFLSWFDSHKFTIGGTGFFRRHSNPPPTNGV